MKALYNAKHNKPSKILGNKKEDLLKVCRQGKNKRKETKTEASYKRRKWICQELKKAQRS